MGRIRVLDEQLANRIAAGEVVDRPASVLKELVENSLDAGARSILVTAEAGGKRLLRVEDDGVGMDRDDAVLAFERHATSKLRGLDDLEAVTTLGFRGEALPAIASVSRLLLSTSDQDGPGTEVEIRAGRILSVREADRIRGTSVEVAGLFFNVPARRRFLRSDATELSHLLRVLTDLALARPAVRFRLEHGGRTLLETGSTGDCRERIEQLFGAGLARTLVPISCERASAKVWGFAGRPADAGTRRDRQHLFVNGRRVHDRTLLHAVSEAYRETVAAGRHPALFLFVEVDPGEVDVNVHPQKAEVRFRRAAEVHDVVREAVAAAFRAPGAVPELADLRPDYAAEPRLPPRTAGAAGVGALPAPQPREPAPRGAAEISRAGPEVLAQLLDSYVVAQEREALVVVDQHAAHERILFERYLSEAEAGRVEQQRLLLPVQLELTAGQAALLEQEAGELARLGFAVEPFGPGVARIDAVPAVAAGADPAKLVRDLLEEAANVRRVATGVAELRRQLVTTAACRAAIKVRTPLPREAMQRLLDDLSRCGNPTTCPHGRPIAFRLLLADIERAFRRR